MFPADEREHGTGAARRRRRDREGVIRMASVIAGQVVTRFQQKSEGECMTLSLCFVFFSVCIYLSNENT